MNATESSTRRGDESELHEIRVQGHLDDRWADWVDGLVFTHEVDGTTTLRGPLPDQAALHGVLNRMRDLGVPILSVRRLDADGQRGNTMLAIVQDRYGSTDTLELKEIERPQIGDGDVLIRVHAAGVDASVRHLMTGEPYLLRLFCGLHKPKARIPGVDVAGRVVAVGRDVTRFRPGEEVFGNCSGAFSEYACAREDRLVLKPVRSSFEQAASIPTSAVTALKALRDLGKVQPGQKVLVIGASGGVGTFAVQIAAALGAEVTGVCSTSKLDLVRSIGADHVIDYLREDFADGPERYDLIVDIAGHRSLSQLRRVLTRTGTLVITGGEGGDKWFGMGRQLRAAVLSLFVTQNLRFFVSTASAKDLLALVELIEADEVTPIIERTYSLAEVPAAIRHFESGRTRGKIAITVHNQERPPAAT